MSEKKCDVLVVGSGPCGMAAALELAKDSRLIIYLLDRDELGGLPRFCDHYGFGIEYSKRFHKGPEFVQYMMGKIKTYPNIKIFPKTTVISIKKGPKVSISGYEIGYKILSPKAVLIATGVREVSRGGRLVPGYRPERGILTTGQVQQMIKHKVPLPLGKVVVIGSELVALSALLTVRKKGLKVVAMLEEEKCFQTFFIFLAKFFFRFKLMKNINIINIHTVDDKACAIEIEQLEKKHIIDCDYVIFSGSWCPDSALAEYSDIEVDPDSKVILTDQHFQTSLNNVFAAGNVLYPAATSGDCANSGKAVGKCIAFFLNKKNTPKRLSRIKIKKDSSLSYIVPRYITNDSSDFGLLSFHLRFKKSICHRFSVVMMKNCSEVWKISKRKVKASHRLSVFKIGLLLRKKIKPSENIVVRVKHKS